MINFKEGMTIRHRKGGYYKVLAVGEMKVDGTWYPSITYQSIGFSYKVYTRASSNMLNFTEVEGV